MTSLAGKDSNPLRLHPIPNTAVVNAGNTATLPPQKVSSAAASSLFDFEELEKQVSQQISAIRNLKGQGVIMETSEDAKKLIGQAQSSLRKLLSLRYFNGNVASSNPPIYVEMLLKFPETMPDFADAGAAGRLLIEMGPIEHVPYSVFYFLEMVANWKNGVFHRNAGHVLQAQVSLNPAKKDEGGGRGLAWQEYSPNFPHKRLTLGYAGRPGGPAFYISTLDNVANHGPGSQGSTTEADGCFGRIVEGEDVVKRMTKQPEKVKPNGFISGVENYITILSVKVVSGPKTTAA